MESSIDRFESELATVQSKLYSFAIEKEKVAHQTHTEDQKEWEEVTEACLEYRSVLENYIEHVNCSTRDFHISLPFDIYDDNIAVKLIKQKGGAENLPIDEVSAKSVAKIIGYFNFINKWENKFREHQLEEFQNYRKLTTKQTQEIESEFEKYKATFEQQDVDVQDSGASNGLSKSTPGTTHSVKISSAEKLKQTNKKITSSLVRSNQVLRASVLQTELNLDELNTQTSLLDELNEKFEIVNTVLTQSGKLIKIVESSGSKEKRQVYYSLGFLALCIAWVLWKRIIRGPLKLILWIWFKFFKSVLFSTGLVKRKFGKYSGMDVPDALLTSIKAFPTISTSVSTPLSANSSQTIESVTSNSTSVVASLLSNITNTTSIEMANSTLQEAITTMVESLFDEL